MTNPKYAFDEEQEFFCTPQGEEMYHTDVVEALNALLAVKEAANSLAIYWRRRWEIVGSRELMCIESEVESGLVKALATLPEHLKAEESK